MGFLGNILRGREIGRLEELVRNSPAPSIFVRLAELYRESGEEDKAAKITEQGVKLFPESESLIQAQASGERIKNDAEKRRLRAKLEQFPSPMLYTKLAGLFIRERDFAQAEATCHSGIRAFPEYGGLWSTLGLVAIEKKEFTAALEHLQKAVSIDEYNYNAMMSLAETNLRLGNRSEAKAALEKILIFAPNDDRATVFLENFDARAIELELDGKAGGVSRTSAVPASVVESKEDKSQSGVGTSLHLEIQQIKRVEGVCGTILIDPSGLVIASDLPEDLNENLAGALITSICRTVKDQENALALGEFEDGIIESEAGSIHILTVDQMTMGVFASANTKTGLLQRAIHAFAERVIDMYN